MLHHLLEKHIGKDETVLFFTFPQRHERYDRVMVDELKKEFVNELLRLPCYVGGVGRSRLIS